MNLQQAHHVFGLSLGVLTVTAAAHASPVIFRIFPFPAYSWDAELIRSTSTVAPKSLDILQPRTQTGSPITSTSVYQSQQDAVIASDNPIVLSWQSGGSVQFSVTNIDNFNGFVGWSHNSTSYAAPRAYLNRADVGNGETWASDVTVAWTVGFGSFTGAGSRTYGYLTFDGQLHQNYSTIPDDMFVGLKLTLADGDHYGYMHVLWSTQASAGSFRNGHYTVSEWAYESVADTAIATPTPGVGTLGACTSLLALRRRRR